MVAVNDRRTFGDYVGQWGRTMENGLPASGVVSLADPGRSVRAVYELSRGGACAFTRDGGRVRVRLDYDTNDGRMLVFLRERTGRGRQGGNAGARRVRAACVGAASG